MPRVTWPHRHGRPIIEIAIVPASGGQPLTRSLIADTGGGTSHSGFELVLSHSDCLFAGGKPAWPITLAGAYAGKFVVYLVPVGIPAIGFTGSVPAIAVPTPPAGFDGIACFRFLNRFIYGNFGDPSKFGLEV